MGKSTIKVPFSIAMLNYQRVRITICGSWRVWSELQANRNHGSQPLAGQDWGQGEATKTHHILQGCNFCYRKKRRYRTEIKHIKHDRSIIHFKHVLFLETEETRQTPLIIYNTITTICLKKHPTKVTPIPHAPELENRLPMVAPIPVV